MTLGVACRAILPHPTGTYLTLPSDWPSHGHQPRSEARVMIKKRDSWSEQNKACLSFTMKKASKMRGMHDKIGTKSWKKEGKSREQGERLEGHALRDLLPQPSTANRFSFRTPVDMGSASTCGRAMRNATQGARRAFGQGSPFPLPDVTHFEYRPPVHWKKEGKSREQGEGG